MAMKLEEEVEVVDEVEVEVVVSMSDEAVRTSNLSTDLRI
jgi:hypothetical protein